MPYPTQFGPNARVCIVDLPLPLCHAHLLGMQGAQIISTSSEDMLLREVAAQAPDLILCPLFALHAGNFEIERALARLAALGYAGAVWVLAPPVPNPRLIEGELRRMGRGLRIRLISGALPYLEQLS